MAKMAKKVRFGIVGCGVIGPTHAQAVARLPEAELVAAMDEMPERAAKLATEFGAKAYCDLDEMLRDADLDVVTICTPSGLHGKQACQAMLAGKHVIVEKPLAIKRETLEEMARTQQKMGVKLAVIFQHRFDAASQRVHDLIQRGALGKLVLGNAHVLWWRAQSYYDGDAWRGTWALDGGGVLMNQGIHSIDLLTWLMGPARSVYAYTDTVAHRMETEDTAVAVLRFENGALGTIAATTAAYPGVVTRVEVMGEKGSAIIEDDKLRYLHVQGEEESVAASDHAPSDTALRDPAALAVDGHTRQIADMIAAIREDRTPAVDTKSGRQAVEIVLAIYESSRTGREVVLG